MGQCFTVVSFNSRYLLSHLWNNNIVSVLLHGCFVQEGLCLLFTPRTIISVAWFWFHLLLWLNFLKWFNFPFIHECIHVHSSGSNSFQVLSRLSQFFWKGFLKLIFVKEEYLGLSPGSSNARQPLYHWAICLAAIIILVWSRLFSCPG